MALKLNIVLILLFSVKLFSQMDSVVSYHDNDKIESVVNMKDGVRDGDARFYWDNGNIKEELSYVNGRVDGLVRRYNENGILQEMFSIENGKREGPTSLFDSTGKYVEDIYYEEGILVVVKFVLDEGKKEELQKTNEVAELNQPQKKKNDLNNKKRKLDQNNPLPEVEEQRYEDDPAFYKTVEVMPEPVGGMEAIYKKISYPKEAIENEVEGTVKILTFIDRDGEVLDAQVTEGIGYGCDEAAQLAVFYHRFKPGMIRGQRVKTQMEILLDFKLKKEDD